jgi:hypothetical protein
MTNKEALDKVIAELIEKIKGMDVGSDEHKAAVDALAKLQDRSTEMERVIQESNDKAAARDRETKNDILEHNLKCEQLKDEHIDRWTKNVLTAFGIIVPTCLTVWGTHASFKFERDGVITTTMGRGFISRLFGKK